MKRLVLFLTAIIAAGYMDSFAQTCSLAGPSNMIIKADKGQEGATVNFPDPAELGVGNCGTVTYTPASGSFFRIGSHSIIVQAENGQKAFFTLTVTDNEPPVLSELTVSARKLSPGKNKLKKVGIYYNVSDNAQEVNTVVTVKSNHSGNGDWEVVNNHLVRLRSTPLPDGGTKIYTITVSCSDASGNITRRSTTVTVPGGMSMAYYDATDAYSDSNDED